MGGFFAPGITFGMLNNPNRRRQRDPPVKTRERAPSEKPDAHQKRPESDCIQTGGLK